MYDLAVSTGNCLGNKKTSIQNIHISMCGQKFGCIVAVSEESLEFLVSSECWGTP